MEIRGYSSGLIESLFAQRFAQGVRPQIQPIQPRQQDRAAPARDLVVFSEGAAKDGAQQQQSRLVSEIQEETDRGFRLVQEFETGEGRTFKRTQEFFTTANGFRREVTQQNPSGSTIRLEETLQRQENGQFQRTQRFINEVGEVETAVENNFVSLDPFVLSGGQTLSPPPKPNLYPVTETTRGTRLDVQA